MNISFISLGPNCHTAGVLKELNYKNCSYPFDWILSNLEIVIYNISNDFIDFMDRNNYIYTSNNKITLKNTNIKYLENMFVHKNPIINKEDFDYYLRCISRFKNLKSTDDYKLFVYTSYSNQYLNNNFKNNISLLKNTLNNWTDKKFYILIINYIKVNNINEQHIYNYIIEDQIIILNINIMYDLQIFYSIDKAIYSFFKLFNPIEEICDKIKNTL